MKTIEVVRVRVPIAGKDVGIVPGGAHGLLDLAVDGIAALRIEIGVDVDVEDTEVASRTPQAEETNTPGNELV